MPAPDPAVLRLLTDASQRLVRGVDDLADHQWAEPSLLPGWTRAHVVAHLALNAEGLAGALDGVARGEAVPMYRSPEARDADIDELAVAVPPDVRARLLASVTNLADAIDRVPADRWDQRVERTPGGPTFPAGGVPVARLREVEVHHVDLGASYTRADWSPEFAALLVDSMAARGGWEHGFVAQVSDLGRSVRFGDGGTTVAGTAADLGWWLTGRGSGEGLTSEGGLPGIGAW